jgi:hypothetical protein
MEKTFNEGDLVHIPQAVLLWDVVNSSGPYIKTEKPITGVLINGSLDLPSGERLVCVYAKGQAWGVHAKDVYLMEEANAG